VAEQFSFLFVCRATNLAFPNFTAGFGKANHARKRFA